MKKFICWFIFFNLLTFKMQAMEKEIDLSAYQSKNEENFICFQIPKITVRKIFEELIIEDSYEGWSIDRKSIAPLIYWTQQGIY